jgi:hypothetical protein
MTVVTAAANSKGAVKNTIRPLRGCSLAERFQLPDAVDEARAIACSVVCHVAIRRFNVRAGRGGARTGVRKS